MTYLNVLLFFLAFALTTFLLFINLVEFKRQQTKIEKYNKIDRLVNEANLYRMSNSQAYVFYTNISKAIIRTKEKAE